MKNNAGQHISWRRGNRKDSWRSHCSGWMFRETSFLKKNYHFHPGTENHLHGKIIILNQTFFSFVLLCEIITAVCKVQECTTGQESQQKLVLTKRDQHKMFQVLVCPCYTHKTPSWDDYLQPWDEDFPFKCTWWLTKVNKLLWEKHAKDLTLGPLKSCPWLQGALTGDFSNCRTSCIHAGTVEI